MLHFSLVEQEYLDSFEGEQEFWYASKDADKSEKGNTPRQDDKWWLPTVRVPANGLSDSYRKWLHHQKDLVAQVLKAAMAINANVLMEMEVPEAYLESLPKVIYTTTWQNTLFVFYNISNNLTVVSSFLLWLPEWKVQSWRCNVQNYN